MKEPLKSNLHKVKLLQGRSATRDNAAWSGIGNKLNNVITESKSSNAMNGGAETDTLIDSSGKDILTSTLGNDYFIFNIAIGTTNVDTTTDFKMAQMLFS